MNENKHYCSVFSGTDVMHPQHVIAAKVKNITKISTEAPDRKPQFA